LFTQFNLERPFNRGFELKWVMERWCWMWKGLEYDITGREDDMRSKDKSGQIFIQNRLELK